MFVLEDKIKPKPHQIEAIEEAIRTTQFVRNKTLRFWMDNHGVGKIELFRYNTQLRKEFKFVNELNSHACQTAVERTLRVALSLIKSNDLVAYEDLNVSGMVKNRRLAKSISDAGWSIFRRWLEAFGDKYGKVTIPVPPHNTSQNCSNCGEKVQKTLSTRTHICSHCGFVKDRDVNAALNILQIGLSRVGRTLTHASGEASSWLVGEILLANEDSLNEESSCL